MSEICTGRTIDRYRTVWECELDAEHTGLCRNGTLMWEGPGLERGAELVARETPEYQPVVHPVRFLQWNPPPIREGGGEVPQIALAMHLALFEQVVEVRMVNPDFDSLVIVGRQPGHNAQSVMHLLPGEWLIIYSDGAVQVVTRDRFARTYERTGA